jgi:hypothetical protein
MFVGNGKFQLHHISVGESLVMQDCIAAHVGDVEPNDPQKTSDPNLLLTCMSISGNVYL